MDQNSSKLKSTDFHYYTSKRYALVLLTISTLFTFSGFFLKESLFNFETQLFKSIILLLGFVLFGFGMIASILYLTRTSPLLTITENRIIIYNILTKQKIVNFEDVKSFFIVTTRHHGIANNRFIFIEMKKPIEKYSNSWLSKFFMKFDIKIATSQLGIQTNPLNINHNKLLEILNERLKKASQQKMN